MRGAMTGMPGMAGMTAPGSGPDLLPTWLGLLGTLVFIAILLSHLRHAAGTSGARRWWHCGHVLMAASMAVMYLPGSILQIGPTAAVWQAVFVVALVVVLTGCLLMIAARRAPSALWLVAALDLATMVYMWSPDTFTAPVSWLAVAYLLGESLLWATDRIAPLDRPLVGGSYCLGGDGTIGVAVAAPLTAHRDLQVSMSAMAIGMAYMIVAMQLMT